MQAIEANNDLAALIMDEREEIARITRYVSQLVIDAADAILAATRTAGEIDALHILSGDDQSVLEQLSTFSAYLLRLKRVLSRATERSLVLLDELGSGTDPEEGAALAAFFFQAEDGIRDLTVTGVQTCALPI